MRRGPDGERGGHPEVDPAPDGCAPPLRDCETAEEERGGEQGDMQGGGHRESYRSLPTLS